MVSKNGRDKENIRENGTNGKHNGRGSDARRRFDQWRAATNAARAAARNPHAPEHAQRSTDAASLLLALSSGSASRRSGAAANSSNLANTLTKNLFIVGVAGIGKTRLIRDVTVNRKEVIGGFYTEPIMLGRIRRGVRMFTFDGQERMLAQKGLKSNLSLGKFGLDLNALENVGVPALKLGMMTKQLMVIDEMGMLEVHSERFKATLQEVLHSDKPVLGTIRPDAKPYLETLKKLPDTQVIVLTRSNFTSIKIQVRKWLDSHL